MADTRRSLSALQTALANNTTGAISAQDIRDLLVSCAPPYGSFYLTTPAATTISVSGTYYKAAGTTTARNLKEFTHANNRLTYTGSPDIHIHLACSISMTAAANNQDIAFRIGKNGDATVADAVASEVHRKIGTGSDVGSTAIHADFMLSTNDYVELFVANETGTANVTLEHIYFFVLGMLV